MVKTLKVLLIIYGVILILAGLGDIFVPEQTAIMFGVTDVSDFAKFGGLGLGAIYVAAGVWLLFASTDPLRNINWVRFVITKAVLSIAVVVYANTMGWIDLGMAGLSMLIADAIMVVLFLVAYPWRKATSSQ
jgi:hypothetical protein